MQGRGEAGARPVELNRKEDLGNSLLDAAGAAKTSCSIKTDSQ